MKTKSIVAAIALVASAAGSFAGDQTIDLSSGTADFGATRPLLVGGDDVITFTNLALGTYDFSVSVTSNFILDLAASLNGQPLAVGAFTTHRFAYLDGSTMSPLSLTVFGSGFPSNAGYSVSITAMPVPELETYALMLAGIGAMGFVALRRKES